MTGFRRLDKLTKMMAQASDTYRATDPKDRRKRERIGRVQQKLRDARAREIYRLSDGGRDRAKLSQISAHLDAVDPYRYGVPASRPVRQTWGRR